jgi:uncharacterized repeat protein (TIGR03803 family)
MKTAVKNSLLFFALIVSFASILDGQMMAQTFTTLHSFNGGDGSSPTAGLVMSGGILYGTAYEGGNFGWGTIYRINADGTGFAKLHDFMRDCMNLARCLAFQWP